MMFLKDFKKFWKDKNPYPIRTFFGIRKVLQNNRKACNTYNLTPPCKVGNTE